jgi:hypothetical protein
MDDLSIFDKIKLSMDLDDPRRKTVEIMENYINNDKFFPTEAGKKYALSKMLNDQNLGLSDITKFKNQDYAKDIEEAMSLKHQMDFKPPDIVAAEQKLDAEDFWNWDSPKHWTKRGVDEMKRRAENAGYSNSKSFVKDVAKVQTDMDRQKLLKDEFTAPGALAVQLLYPRATESLLKGKDIEGKDIGLDLFEQGMYALDPAGRAIAASKIGTGAAAKTLLGIGGAFANPAIMELGDEVAYANDADSPRNKASLTDIAFGGGINYGMGKMLDMLHLKPELKGEWTKRKEIADRVIPQGIKNEETKLKNIEAKYGPAHEKTLEQRDKLDYIYGLRDRLDKESQIIEQGISEGIIKDLPSFKERLKYAGRENPINLISNKAGDAASENPRMTKRIIRTGLGPVSRMVSPFLNDWIDTGYGDDKKQAKKELDKQLELIYGLQDWEE